MKNKLFLTALIIGQFSFAKTNFECQTNSAEREYVSKRLLVNIDDDQIVVQTCDSQEDAWTTASIGLRQLSYSKDNSVRFEGFDSDAIFGDLSEGRADDYIRIDVSSEVIAGKNGTIRMASKGSEVGRQSAKYKCVRPVGPQTISKKCVK